MKILIIEDNEELRNDIVSFLQAEGFITEATGSVAEAIERIELYQYDLLVVDIGLPDGSGLEIVKYAKESKPECGIIILTAKNKLEDKVEGLNLGADDYMTKPFHTVELKARILSILRRNKFSGDNTITIENIKIDILSMEVKVNDELLNLTRKEFDLLLFFTQNRNRLLTKESIAEHLWGDHADQADNFDFIYNHVKNLRRKISQSTGKNYIKAMYGMGYKFVVE